MVISEEQIHAHLKGAFGHEITIYDVIDSTNNAAKLLAKNGAPHGSAVVARRQTAGKGRLGRSFHSPQATGVYLTVILRPSLPAAQAVLLTPAAAVATARAIQTVGGAMVQIKWVNDLYCGGKKICGILAESALDTSGGLQYVVVGIGVNLTTQFSGELAETATSLAAVCGAAINPNHLIAEILNEYGVICDTLEDRAFIEEYKERSCVLGKRVSFADGPQILTGVATDIDKDARLLITLDTGEKRWFYSGEISLRGDWK